MPRPKARNELLAGIFIVVALVLALVVLMVLADWKTLFQDTHEVRVVFHDQSVKGLKEGSVVQFNGVPVGEVTELHIDYANPEHIDAIIEIPADLTLYANASVYIATAALGGNAWIEIEHVGSPEGVRVEAAKGAEAWIMAPSDEHRRALATIETVPPADKDHWIYGSERPNALIADMANTAGFGDRQRTQLQETIASIHAAAGRLDATLADVQGGVKQLRSDVLPPATEAAANIRDMTASGKEMMAARMPALLDRIDGTLTEVDTMVRTQRPVVAKALENVQHLTGTLDSDVGRILTNFETALTDLNATMATARESMDNIRQLTGTARDVVVVNRENIHDTLANFREGSEHYAATLAEVRRNPWRLLYKPKPGEVESANVLESARAFSEGATKLRQTVTRLKVLVELRDGQIPDNDPQLAKVLKDLRDSLERFDKAEKSLYQSLPEK